MTEMYVLDKNIHCKYINFGDDVNKKFNTKKLKTSGNLHQWLKVMKMDNIRGGYIVFTTSYSELKRFNMNDTLHLIESI